jgi:hypothetical protein
MKDLPSKKQMYDLLESINQIFPLPVSDTFRGSHHITLQNLRGNGLEVCYSIWFFGNDGKIYCRDFILEDGKNSLNILLTTP